MDSISQITLEVNGEYVTYDLRDVQAEKILQYELDPSDINKAGVYILEVSRENDDDILDIKVVGLNSGGAEDGTILNYVLTEDDGRLELSETIHIDESIFLDFPGGIELDIYGDYIRRKMYAVGRTAWEYISDESLNEAKSIATAAKNAVDTLEADTKTLAKTAVKEAREAKKMASELNSIVQTAGYSETAVMSQKAVTELIGVKVGKNLFNKNDPDVMMGSSLSAAGVIQTITTGNYPTTNYYVSGYIPVDAGKTYSIKPCPAVAYAAFYDSSKAFVSALAMGIINSGGYKTEIPDGVSYMRITAKIEAIDTQMVAEGTEGYNLVYEPYGYTNPIKSLRDRVDTLGVDYSQVRNYQIEQGESIDLLNDLSALKQTKYPNTAENLSAAKENTRIAKYGKSIEMNTLVANGSCTLYKSVSLDFSEKKKTLSMWVYLPKLYENVAIQMILNTSTSLYDTPTKATATVYTNTMYTGWTMLVFDEEDFNLGASFDWGSIKLIGISTITPSSVSDFRMMVNDLRVGATWIPKIIFRFDDALKGVYANAEPALRARGMSGIVYCNTLFNERADNGEIDPVTTKPYSEGYCTSNELMEMYNNGFDISNHSHSHLVFVSDGAHYDYEDTDDDETKRTSVLRQIRKGQNWLINKGFVKSARHFAVPGGHDTVLCQEALKDCGMHTSGNSVHDHFVPNNNIHKIPAWGVANTTTVDQIKTWITNAVVRGRTVVLMFHDVLDELADLEDGGYSEIRYQYLTSDFEAILDWIVEQGWAEYVVSMSDWYEGLNRE